MGAYRRISGELAKLGLRVSKSCVVGILRRNNLPPSPGRKGFTWAELLARQADVPLRTDLFPKEIWTFCGHRSVLVLAIMHLKSRTTLLAEAIFSPHASRMPGAGCGHLLRRVLPYDTVSVRGINDRRCWAARNLGAEQQFLGHRTCSSAVAMGTLQNVSAAMPLAPISSLS